MKDDVKPPRNCPVCGSSDPASCRQLDRLGIKSLTADHNTICPVCGGDYALIVWTGSYKMCELCAENKAQAVRILKHKHRKKLNRILAALDSED